MRGAVVRRVLGGMALLVGCAALAGCGGSYGFDGNTSQKTTTLGNLLAFNSLKAPAALAAPVEQEQVACPEIQVLDGTASSRVYGSGGDTNQNVRYQFSMGDAVRDCSHAGGRLTLRVGVEGRALLGPVGAPGSFVAPVRIAVRNERDGKAIFSKLYQVPVTVPAGETSAPFSVVADDVSVPYLSAHGDEDYTVLVGFDAKGDAHLEKAVPRRARKHKAAE